MSMQIEIKSLKGMALDAAMALMEGYELTTDSISLLAKKDGKLLIVGPGADDSRIRYSPSTKWEQLGPLIKTRDVVLANHSSGNEETPDRFWGSAHCFHGFTRFETYDGIEVAACRSMLAYHHEGTSLTLPNIVFAMCAD